MGYHRVHKLCLVPVLGMEITEFLVLASQLDGPEDDGESPTASFTTCTSKQYDSRWRNPSVGADRLGSVRCVVSGVSLALLSWPDVSPAAIISCREVLSLVKRASSASFFGTPFPLSSLGGSLEAMSAIRQLQRLSELRGSCESGKNYHGARVETITALM